VLKPWRVTRWCARPRENGACAAAMEDVLEVYARPLDPRRPLVCFDEAGKELQTDCRAASGPLPGRPARQDYEYVRAGSRNLFLVCAPLLGWRRVAVTERRTAHDFAHAVRRLVEEDFPEAEKIVLVLDNLNTHKAAALYQTFPPALARRLWAKLEVHYTPLHGSWLNLAEIELSVLARQCLDRRLPDAETLTREVAAWTQARNAEAAPVSWRLTLADARVALKEVYPIVPVGQ
jgi:hypothetical protein